MSVAVDSNALDSSRVSGNQSPREVNRPAPMNMGKIPLSFPSERNEGSTASPNGKPSPNNIYRQSTMTGSYSNDSRADLQ